MSRYDESDARIRPGANKARRRTKDRPQHADAIPGLVVAVDRGRFTVVVELGEDTEHPVYAIKARDLGRKGVVVGDRVAVVGDTTGNEGSLARIVAIEERQSLLRRSSDDTEAVERVIVANAELLLIVQALADPPPRVRFIDRCVIAALDAGIEPVIVLTKQDLGDDAEIRRVYAAFDLPIFTVGPDADLTELNELLSDRVSVLIGHSGVGKSTLVNRLVPDAERSTGNVNVVTGRGRHTSTSAVALQLPQGGWIIDTPGVRSFGLAHVDSSNLLRFFPDLEEGDALCPRACSHNEAECGLDAWAEEHGVDPQRLESLRRLINSLQSGDDR